MITVNGKEVDFMNHIPAIMTYMTSVYGDKSWYRETTESDQHIVMTINGIPMDVEWLNKAIDAEVKARTENYIEGTKSELRQIRDLLQDPSYMSIAALIKEEYRTVFADMIDLVIDRI